MTAFRLHINDRIAETQASLNEARLAGDDYLVEIRLGELESLARIAAEHGIEVDGVEESLAAHGLTTPPLGVPLVIDLRADRAVETSALACPEL